MHYADHITPNVQRSTPFLRPAHRVIGWTPMQAAQSLVAQAEASLPILRDGLRAANAQLGLANSWRVKDTRPQRRAAAMRMINTNRRHLLNAHRQLDAARAEVARLEQLELPLAAPVPAPVPAGPRVLRQPRGTFPAGTTAAVTPGTLSGWHATIIRPHGAGGVATHHTDEGAALAWVDATLAAPVLH